jgi:hypothetical protein
VHVELRHQQPGLGVQCEITFARALLLHALQYRECPTSGEAAVASAARVLGQSYLTMRGLGCRGNHALKRLSENR